MAENLLERLRELHRYWQVPGQERAVLFRSLAVMFSSGVNLDRALQMLGEQMSNPGLRKACQELSKQVQSGHYLSNAMRRLPWAFTNLQIRLVAVGEKSGQLGGVFVRLAEYEEKRVEIEMKVRSALVMPIILSCLCLTMVALVPPFLFQGLFEILKETGGTLPWPTRVLMLLSGLMTNPLSYLVVAVLAATFFRVAWSLYQKPNTARRFFGWIRSLPIFGNTLKMLSVTRFAHTLSTLTHVGIPILQALEHSAAASDDPYLIYHMSRVIETVTDGEPLGTALHDSDCFPAGFCHGVSAGEESGRLSAMLESLSRLYEVELMQSIETLSKALEPLMMAVIGVIVGFTVVATLLPMLKVIESL